jgi:trehalose 6-phosphate synthase
MAAARRKLIVVANRGPASYERAANGERIARRGGGGLVTALRGLIDHHEVTWIASAISDEDRVVASDNEGRAFDESSRDGSPFRLRLVAHDERAYDWFYNVVSNPTLWFIQHHLWDLKESPNLDHAFHHAWVEGYAAVNRNFADAVLDELEREPDATVFFHDYHLYLAPRLVRDARPDAALQHFVHIPWPQADYWHVLPLLARQQIHEGILANDAVGFHTPRWRRSFLRCCEDFLGAECDFSAGLVEYEGRTVRVNANPISVDVKEFDELAESERVLDAERALGPTRPEQLILRVDRTDPSKNIVRGFRAFELLLDEHPELQWRVGLLALLDPSRQDVPEYAEYVGAIQREARRVNGRFAPIGWTPIDLRVEDDFAASVAAYKQYDVLLVNAIFDGLNLVAKEAPLVNTRDGVLVLSENAGAHDELGDFAVTVNPFDVAGQAEALYEALQMGVDERRRRIEGIRAHVREHDLSAWLESELQAAPGAATARR